MRASNANLLPNPFSVTALPSRTRDGTPNPRNYNYRRPRAPPPPPGTSHHESARKHPMESAAAETHADQPPTLARFSHNGSDHGVTWQGRRCKCAFGRTPCGKLQQPTSKLQGLSLARSSRPLAGFNLFKTMSRGCAGRLQRTGWQFAEVKICFASPVFSARLASCRKLQTL